MAGLVLVVLGILILLGVLKCWIQELYIMLEY